MKVLLILFNLLFYSFVFAQDQPVTNFTKPIIDTGSSRKWPYLDGNTPLLSSNGSYVAYVINNMPLKSATLVIHTIDNSWKKEVVVNKFRNYFFNQNGSKIYWVNADTLFSLKLKSDKLDYISKISSIKFSKLNKGEWIAYKLKSYPNRLFLLNGISERQIRYDSINDYAFNDDGSVLVLKRAFNNGATDGEKVQWISLQNDVSVSIWDEADQYVSDFCFDKSGKQLSFMSGKSKENFTTIWYYEAGMSKAILKVSKSSPGFPENKTLSLSSVQFSKNGKWLFFSMMPNDSTPKLVPEISKVDIWSYKDKLLFPQQSSKKDRLTAVIAIKGSKVVVVTSQEDDMAIPAESVTGDYAVVLENSYTNYWWSHSATPKYSVVSLNDGKRINLNPKTDYPLVHISFSPLGKWIIYWDIKSRAFISYNLATRRSYNITRLLPPITNDYNTGTYSFPVAPIIGWYENDSALLLYDRYDIWKVDPQARVLPINITNEYGAKHHVKLRIVDQKADEYNGNETLLLTGFNTINKYNGFYSVNLKLKKPDSLSMGPYTYYRVESQKEHNYSFNDGMKPIEGNNTHGKIWILKRQSAVEYPNFYLTRDFVHFQNLTNLQPHKQNNWITTELINWKQFDGKIGQGILYKPENFDPGRKYPVIFNYYERLSHRLFEFPFPRLTEDNIDIPWFVSRGYLVFTPDIQFSVASHKDGKTVGEATYNSVVSAAKHLSTLNFVDGKKMAIQGHSFGGAETNYLVTHTGVFAAASEMAGGADPISAYLTLAGGIKEDMSKQEIAESGLGRYGANPWERPDLYFGNSAVLSADKAITPLLIVHNKNDNQVPWRQGVELYMAFRRLGKKCWMLQYDNSSHTVDGKDALDYTIRLTQFFDHYLKGTSPPRWMTENLLAQYKGVENLYELDSKGSCGRDCLVCNKQQSVSKK